VKVWGGRSTKGVKLKKEGMLSQLGLASKGRFREDRKAKGGETSRATLVCMVGGKYITKTEGGMNLGFFCFRRRIGDFWVTINSVTSRDDVCVLLKHYLGTVTKGEKVRV